MLPEFLVSCIKSGLLQNRVTFDTTTKTTIVDRLGTRCERLLCILTYFLKKSPQLTRVVYRGMSLSSVADELHHPLPFSTSTSLSFVQSWLYMRQHPVILVIQLERVSGYIIPHDDENEIIVQAGTLCIVGEPYIDNGIKHYQCVFKK